MYNTLIIYAIPVNFDCLFFFYYKLLISCMILGLQNLSESDKFNLEAITKIHFHLDDDRNGKVDLSESNGVSAQ